MLGWLGRGVRRATPEPALSEWEATMADSIKDDVAALREDLDALRSDIGSLAATLKGMAGNAARSAGDAAEENVEELRQRLERLADEVRHRGRAASESIQRQVEERPITSLLVAFALGLVISRLFDRR